MPKKLIKWLNEKGNKKIEFEISFPIWPKIWFYWVWKDDKMSIGFIVIKNK